MKLIFTTVLMSLLNTFLVHRFFEVRQNLIKAPTFITQLSPAIKILRMAANINHSIDRTGPA